MIPPLSRWVISLQTPILNREQISEDPLLDHRLAEQPAPIARTSAQLLTCSLHAQVLALELEFLGPALLRLEQLPGAVDCPVAEVAVSGEAEGARGQWVVEEVADECCGLALAFVWETDYGCGRVAGNGGRASGN
jgi:hypothetical protein